MKINYCNGSRRQNGRLIQTFGQADLIKLPDGRFELRGGSSHDEIAAREWSSLFLHEAVFVVAGETR